MPEVFGDRDAVLRRVESLVECEVLTRGNEVTLRGGGAAVEAAEELFSGLIALAEEGNHPTPEMAERMFNIGGGGEGRRVLGDVILTHRGRRVAPKTRNQKAYTDAIREHQVVFGVGPAGTGKTYLAVALAVDALNRGDVSRIILTRPVVEAGESLGFLPGDVMAKVDPYFRPLYDALYEMIDPAKFQVYLERGIIEIAPLAFMRGRTLNDAFIILDEAQNTTPQQMKMFPYAYGVWLADSSNRGPYPGRPPARPGQRSRGRPAVAYRCRGSALRGSPEKRHRAERPRHAHSGRLRRARGD